MARIVKTEYDSFVTKPI